MYKKSLNYLLNRSSTFLNLDTKYFAKASFYSGIQQSIGILSGIVISYFFGHFVPKNIFGEYNLILSIIGFLTIVTLPGLDSYLTRSIAQKYDSSFIRSVRIKFYLSLIGATVLLGFALYHSSNILLTTSFIVTALFFPFLAPTQLFSEFLTAKHRFKKQAIFFSFSSILSAILISVAITVSGSLTLLLIAYFVGILIPSTVAVTQILKITNKNPKKIDKELISNGIFNTILTIIPWSAGYLGQISLGILLGSEALAIFVVASKMPLYMHKNLFVFYKPLTAKLAQQSHQEHLDTLKKHAWKLVVWGILLALPIYLFSPFIIKFIFTDKYTEAIPFAQILSLSVIPLPLTWVIGDILTFQRIKKPRLYTSLLVNTIKIILYFGLIPIYKLTGLVIVFLLDRYISLIFDLSIIYLYHKNYTKI